MMFRSPGRPGFLGLHVFSPAIFDVLRSRKDVVGSLAEAVQRLAADGGRVELDVGQGWWDYGGTADDLLSGNRIALDELPQRVDEVHRHGNRIEGRVHVQPTARLRRSVLRGPVLVGEDATIVDSYVGPYTAVGDVATIDNAEIESSIVLTGAHIANVGARIESSIIGQGGAVTRGFELPHAVRRLIGDEARVELA